MLRGDDRLRRQAAPAHRPAADAVEDLPLVAVAVDARGARSRRRCATCRRSAFDGLVTLERARLLTAPRARRAARPSSPSTSGARERADGAASVVALLHRHGVAGATVLLGVDGTAHGERRRARFFGRNAGVPLMVISVGDGRARSPPRCRSSPALLERPLVTLERVRVCKRDGAALAAPGQPRPTGDAWQKLMVYAASSAPRRPLYLELVRRLRATGAAGATTLRGIWGYHGDHAPHGDSALAAAPARAGGDRGRRPARERGALVAAARRADRRDRAGDERARTDRASPGGRVG